MDKKLIRNIFIFTIIVVVILSATVFACIQVTRTRMTEYSFERLTEVTNELATDLEQTLEADCVLLTAMSNLIATFPLSDIAAVTSVMSSFSYDYSLLSEVMLLFPNDRILDANGNWWADLSGEFTFAEESTKGNYITDRRSYLLDPERYAVYHVAPVVQDGEVVAILFGIALLDEISSTYTTNYYGGDAFVIIADGTTGDIIVDTWHDTLGNMNAFERQVMLYDTFPEMIHYMKLHMGGNIAFVSKTIGEVLYVHYEPMEVNNWSVCLGVSESIALNYMHSCVHILYIMAIVISAVLAAYTIYIVVQMIRSKRFLYKMSITDPCTQLLNRAAYEDYRRKNRANVFPDVTCIYVDVNGLHELNNQFGHDAGDAMLQTAALCMTEEFPHALVYRIGGDEFVLILQDVTEADTYAAIDRITARLAENDYSVAIGLVRREKERGLERIIREADAVMRHNKNEYYMTHDRRKPRHTPAPQ